MEKKFGKNWISYTVAACAAVCLYFFFRNFQTVSSAYRSIMDMLSPVFIGAVLAYLLNPIVVFFETKPLKKIKRKQTRHYLSVFLTFVLVVAMLTGIIFIVFPALIDNMSTLINNANTYLGVAEKYVHEFAKNAEKLNFDVSKLTLSAEDLVNRMSKAITTNMSNILLYCRNAGLVALNVIIGVVLAVYFLIEKSVIMASIDKFRRALLTDKTYEEHNKFWKRCNKILVKFIGVDLLDAMIVGITNAAFMLVTGMPNVAIISLVIGLTNLIPTFGPFIGGGFACALLLLSAPDKVILFLIFTVVLQCIDGYLLKPKLFGETMGVSPVGILVCVIVGGKLFGFTGLLVAIPFAAIWTIFYTETLLPILRKRKKLAEEKNKEA